MCTPKSNRLGKSLINCDEYSADAASMTSTVVVFESFKYDLSGLFIYLFLRIYISSLLLALIFFSFLLINSYKDRQEKADNSLIQTGLFHLFVDQPENLNLDKHQQLLLQRNYLINSCFIYRQNCRGNLNYRFILFILNCYIF